jgi:hypothetical protein
MENQELAKALAKAQKEVKDLEKSATSKVRLKSGGEYSFDYVPLEAVLDEARRVLASNGISFQQHITRDDKGLCLFTELMHESGQSKVIPTPVIGNPTNMQEMGSLFTYAKRYAMLGILGIAGSDDIDANDTNEKNESFTVTQKDKVMQQPNNYAAKAPMISEAQVKRLWAIAKAKGFSQQEVINLAKDGFNKSEVSTLNKIEYDKLCKHLETNKPEQMPF